MQWHIVCLNTLSGYRGREGNVAVPFQLATTVHNSHSNVEKLEKLRKSLFYSFLAGRVDEKAAQLHAITSLQAMLGAHKNPAASFVDGVNGNNSQRNTSSNQGPEVRQTS